MCVSVGDTMKGRESDSTSSDAIPAVAVVSLAQQHMCLRGRLVDASCEYYGDEGTCRKYTVTPSVARTTLTFLDIVLLAFAAAFQLPHLTVGFVGASTTRASKIDQWLLSLLLPASLSSMVSVSPIALCILSLVVARLIFRKFVMSEAESVLAVRGVGLQLTTRRSGREVVNRLVDVNTIECLAIHEGYYRHQVVYFAVLVVRDAPCSIVLFEESLPRLDVLRAVLRGLRHVLYGEPEVGPSLAQLEQATK